MDVLARANKEQVFQTKVCLLKSGVKFGVVTFREMERARLPTVPMESRCILSDLLLPQIFDVEVT